MNTANIAITPIPTNKSIFIREKRMILVFV